MATGGGIRCIAQSSMHLVQDRKLTGDRGHGRGLVSLFKVDRRVDRLLLRTSVMDRGGGGPEPFLHRRLGTGLVCTRRERRQCVDLMLEIVDRALDRG